jgi:hypothetical protein
MTSDLLWECRIIGNYLVGKPLPPELSQRYIDAHGILFPSEAATDLSLVRFVRRYPWSLPFLDARLGFLKSDSLLRQKILLMTAILEATPEFTEFFLPNPMSRCKLFFCLIRYGVSAVTKLLIGLILFPLAVYSTPTKGSRDG